MAGNPSRRNGQRGGRPLDRKNDATLEREAQLERLRQRVFEAFDPLINAQLSLARGVWYLFEEDIEDDDSKGRPILVVDPEEIQACLAEDYNALSMTYYYITTKVPENAALKDLWDPALGKKYVPFWHIPFLINRPPTPVQRVRELRSSLPKCDIRRLPRSPLSRSGSRREMMSNDEIQNTKDEICLSLHTDQIRLF